MVILDKLIYQEEISGLKEAILVLSNVKGIDMIFLITNAIRHNLVKKVIQAYTQTEHNN